MAVTKKARHFGIREVARRAGVSTATVSRVFNASPAVLPETRERVLNVAAAVGYRPSSLGRNLVRGRSDLVGVIVPNIAVPLYGEMLHGIEGVLDTHGMTAVVMSSLDDPATERRVARALQRHAIDGGIVINSRVGAGLPVQRQAPWVHVAPEIPDLPYRVELDNVAGGRLAARHLLAGGGTDFAFIGSAGRESAERERGFAAELGEAGRAYARATGDYSEASGGQEARALFAAGRPDALFVAGDLMAAGVLRALHERGLHVGRDVAVVGFDDAQLAALLYPRLSSVYQPAFEMGQAAAHLARQLIEGRAPAPVTFTPGLVVRESSRSLAQ